MKIVLVERGAALARAWRRELGDDEAVEVVEGDYFSRPADAMVSPANSFGIMDGGLDLAIRDRIGGTIQRRVQKVIVERHHGELPVGCAEIVETGDAEWPHLVIAPTMRVPENVSRTTNAYLAFRAALLACRRHGAIETLVCCGLGTGIGQMEPDRCAVQMKLALMHVRGPARIPSFDAIHAIHAALRSS